MKTKSCLMVQAALCGALMAGPPQAGQAAKRTPDAARSAEPSKIDPPETLQAARVVAYAGSDVVPVKTKVRYTTLIVLPKNEQILDFTCGDKEFWVVNGNQNFAYVKPARTGAQTNLNLVTASGNVYSFLLSEVSETPKAEPDLKIFVELKDETMTTASRGAPKFVSAQDVEGYKAEAAKAKEELRQVKDSQQSAIRQGISKYVSNMRFPYRFEAGKKPFFVRAMYHDDRLTYIQARPEETPTLYEIKDGQPNLINFDYKDGVYVVDKILDRGYLVIGKQKLSFAREE